MRPPLTTRVERRIVHGLVRMPRGWVGRLVRPAPELADNGPLDPGIALILALQRLRGLHGMASADPRTTRVRMRRQTTLAVRVPTPVGAVEDLEIPGADGPLAARHYRPPDTGGPYPLLVFFHGGGFIAGDLDGHDEPCRMLCRHGGVQVLSVAYRLAPEHPFPAGVEDAYAAAQWALANAGRLGADPGRVAVGGDSAGANLATVACLLGVRRQAPLPAAQVLFYPPTDYHTAWPSRASFAEGLLLTGADIDFCHQHYGGFAYGPDDERHSPLRSTDLAGLPPALVVTAAFDPLRDEGEAYAEAMRAAGTRVICWRVPGMVHGFLNLTGLSSTARDTVIAAAGAARTLLAGVPARENA